ncbi:DNA-(apurinic or apyrimidinic site) lyase 2 [Bienertia sinuspersici]
MASQNSGDSLSTSGARSMSRSSVPLVKCYHDDIAPIRTVRVNCPTQGRRFYGCSHYPVKKLKQTTIELEDQVAELAIENTEKFHAMETVKADKKLCIMLFMSWV